MKVTAELIQKEIQAKLPSYYTTYNADISYRTDKYEGWWFSMIFTYPGSGQKYVWVSINPDMTVEEVDTWTTDAVIQMKLSQEVEELRQQARDIENRINNTTPAIGE